MKGVVALAIALIGCAAAPAPAPVRAPASAPAPARPIIVSRAQTREEAFDYLWQQLAQMEFFRARGYRVALPDHPLFRELAEHGVAGADREAARRVFDAEVYDATAFEPSLRALDQIAARLEPALATFATWERAWGFELHDRYELVLTLYGPGGSYDPDKGRVTILTTPTGAFRMPPLQNAVHEMVHMGIERPIVRRFGLSHEEKEHLVDLVCLRAFHDLLPQYRAQPMGPPEMDPFVDDAALADLPKAIERYVATRRAPVEVR